MTKYDESARYLARAGIIPGRSLTHSKAPGRMFDVGTGPLYASYGDGCRLTDVDGNEFVDMVCALGAISLGYGAAADAAQDEVSDGWVYSLPSFREVVAAETFLEHVAPWASSVRFVKTGSEALQAAVRFARAATSRSIILIADNAYHGWHDWVQASHGTRRTSGGGYEPARVDARIFSSVSLVHPPMHWCLDDTWPNGVPIGYTSGIGVYRYGDMGSLAAAASAAGSSSSASGRTQQCVGAVIVEPARWEDPNPDGFLQRVRNWCDANGALMIVDEMIYGGRWALGGATQHFGVTPDLACFGKAIGNGAPIACVAGNEALAFLGETVSGTYSGDAAALAAMQATLLTYASSPVVETLWANGRLLQAGLREIAASAPSPCVAEGQAVHQRLRFTERPDLGRVFAGEMASRGVLWHPDVVNVMAAHAPTDINLALDAARASMAAVRA